MAEELDLARAEMLAGVVLGHVTRPYPHKLEHVLTRGDAPTSPEILHPLFFGSFDWHSCVHGYWSLARLLARCPSLPSSPAIRTLFDRQFTAGNVAAEVAYFERPVSRGFERPYGWAWLLMLAVELAGFPDEGWADALRPLAMLIRNRFAGFLPLATYPVRVGTHFNTAFALLFAAGYATSVGDDAFLRLLRDKAVAWYGADADCQAWEPGGDDFLSPALIEAVCMLRLLSRDAFLAWFGAFLPRLGGGEPATLFQPAIVTDRTDGKLAHLDGLNLSRAWCWRMIAEAFDPGDPRVKLALDASRAHLASGLPNVVGDYMGEHWLVSFALLALQGCDHTRCNGGGG